MIDLDLVDAAVTEPEADKKDKKVKKDERTVRPDGVSSFIHSVQFKGSSSDKCISKISLSNPKFYFWPYDVPK